MNASARGQLVLAAQQVAQCLQALARQPLDERRWRQLADESRAHAAGDQTNAVPSKGEAAKAQPSTAANRPASCWPETLANAQRITGWAAGAGGRWPWRERNPAAAQYAVALPMPPAGPEQHTEWLRRVADKANRLAQELEKEWEAQHLDVLDRKGLGVADLVGQVRSVAESYRAEAGKAQPSAPPRGRATAEVLGGGGAFDLAPRTTDPSLATLATLLVAAMLLFVYWRRTRNLPRDSVEFQAALDRWRAAIAPLPYNSSPRRIRRFENRTRYYAMRLRNEPRTIGRRARDAWGESRARGRWAALWAVAARVVAPPVEPLKITDANVVAFGAIYHSAQELLPRFDVRSPEAALASVDAYLAEREKAILSRVNGGSAAGTKPAAIPADDPEWREALATAAALRGAMVAPAEGGGWPPTEAELWEFLYIAGLQRAVPSQPASAAA